VAIHNVIEVLSESTKSWEDAADLAVKDAAKSLKGIKSIYKELSGGRQRQQDCNTALMPRSLLKSADDRSWPAVPVSVSHFSDQDYGGSRPSWSGWNRLISGVDAKGPSDTMTTRRRSDWLTSMTV
jgi:hypothetical protein